MTDLQWLAATILLTAICWLPYILNRITTMGLMPALGNPSSDDPKGATWAGRAKAAHMNAVENLVLFAPLLLIANAMGMSGEKTLLFAKIYFFARLAHYIVYWLGIPVVRTLTFTAGWLVTILLALKVLGIL